ncbi:hypothetical protein [Rhabdaerophilum sp. SD176]|uniref:hypothetical protein n=1 Tax=Rhabdaerophilum sp. SD176 TaxID=2983548 RepID=UPI0024DFFAF9|nr:hypothetical protein [Rhabdaerophilum sp. SD176]
MRKAIFGMNNGRAGERHGFGLAAMDEIVTLREKAVAWHCENSSEPGMRGNWREQPLQTSFDLESECRLAGSAAGGLVGLSRKPKSESRLCPGAILKSEAWVSAEPGRLRR